VYGFSVDEVTGGNAAGVVTDCTLGLSPGQKLAIAKELNFSETVFVGEITTEKMADGEGERTVLPLEYFTPAGEVDLCGHATSTSHDALPPHALTAFLAADGVHTVASLGYLFERKLILPELLLVTRAGNVRCVRSSRSCHCTQAEGTHTTDGLGVLAHAFTQPG
jgi:hypothetical protein